MLFVLQAPAQGRRTVCSGNIVILWADIDTKRAVACWLTKYLLGVKGNRHLMSGFRECVIITFSFGTGNAVAVTI